MKKCCKQRVCQCWAEAFEIVAYTKYQIDKNKVMILWKNNEGVQDCVHKEADPFKNTEILCVNIQHRNLYGVWISNEQ